MLDSAELKKEGDGGAPEPGRRASSRLLAAALVFDAVLVVAFGGAVAAKLYQHWKAPVAPPAAVRQNRKPAKVEAPPEPAKPPEPPKQAEAPKPEPPKPEPSKEPVRPPKPSLLAETPKPRETPKPQAKAPETPKAAPVVTAPAGKAVAVEFKLKAPSAKHVGLGGAFIVRGGRKDMVRQPDGLWTLTLYLTPNTYRYTFIVDGKRMKDPENPSSSLTVQPQ